MNFRLGRTWRDCVFKYTPCFFAWQDMSPKGSWVGGMIPTPWWVAGGDWIVRTLSSWTDRPVSTFAVKCLRKLSGLAGGHGSLNVCLPRMHFDPEPSPSSLRFLAAMRGTAFLYHTLPSVMPCFNLMPIVIRPNSHYLKPSKLWAKRINFIFSL